MSARSKTQERRVARFFGTERTPLSGGASRHTRSDTLHPTLYLEVKSVMANSGSNAWVWRLIHSLRYAGKMVYFAPQNLYVAHTGAIEPHAAYKTTLVLSLKAACLRLWKQTQKLAAQEKKVPLIALCCKGKRGFWLVGDAEGILAAQRVRAEGGWAMKIIDARWTPRVNMLLIECLCGNRFEHRSDRWIVRCRRCGREGYPAEKEPPPKHRRKHGKSVD